MSGPKHMTEPCLHQEPQSTWHQEMNREGCRGSQTQAALLWKIRGIASSVVSHFMCGSIGRTQKSNPRVRHQRDELAVFLLAVLLFDGRVFQGVLQAPWFHIK